MNTRPPSSEPEPENEAGEAVRAEASRAFLAKLSGYFEREFIVIGGWAVDAYGARNYPLDGDAMISCEVQGTLRDSYEVTHNARMHKEQFRGPAGGDIDLYVERRHRLPVAFSELQAHSEHRARMWVACPEHLAILKLAAWRERGHTPKGRKDREDLIRLFDRAGREFKRSELLAGRLGWADWSDLRAVCADPKATAGQREARALSAGPAFSRNLPAAMVVSRLHRPERTVTLAALCREAGCVCPVQTDRPLRVERLPGWAGDAPPTRHWRNLPDGSYSTYLHDAAAIIAMLAYEAHEWQAWEVRRELRRRGGPGRFALLT